MIRNGHRKLPPLEKDWVSTEPVPSGRCSSTQSTVSNRSRQTSVADTAYEFPLPVVSFILIEILGPPEG